MIWPGQKKQCIKQMWHLTLWEGCLRKSNKEETADLCRVGKNFRLVCGIGMLLLYQRSSRCMECHQVTWQIIADSAFGIQVIFIEVKMAYSGMKCQLLFVEVRKCIQIALMFLDVSVGGN